MCKVLLLNGNYHYRYYDRNKWQGFNYTPYNETFEQVQYL